MSLISIIAIIAAIIFAVLSVLIVLSIAKSKVEVEEKNARINRIENQLGIIGEQLAQATTMLEQRAEDDAKEAVRAASPEDRELKVQKQQEIGQQKNEKIDEELGFGEIDVAKLNDAEFNIEEIEGEVDDGINIEEIDDIDGYGVINDHGEINDHGKINDERDIDDLISLYGEIGQNAQDIEAQEYAVGQSGKKYTVKELISIIEE